MKIDVTQNLKQLDGSPLTQATARCPECGQTTESRILILRRVVVDALMAQRQDQELSGGQKVRRYAIATQIHNEDAPDLKVEDVALIKKLVGEVYGPLVVGQAWAMLDPIDE